MNIKKSPILAGDQKVKDISVNKEIKRRIKALLCHQSHHNTVEVTWIPIRKQRSKMLQIIAPQCIRKAEPNTN